MKRTHIALTDHSIDSGDAVKFVSDPQCGGIATFLGVTRCDKIGENIVHELLFESHPPLAQSVLDRIVKEYRIECPDLEHVYIVHRLGRVPVGDTNIVIAVSATHRKCTFRAINALMERVKEELPIWKKEIFTDQSSRWIENTEFSLARTY